MIFLHTNIIHGNFTLIQECFALGIQSWNFEIIFFRDLFLQAFTECHYFSHNCFFSQRDIYYIPGDFQNSFKSKHRLNSDIYLHFVVDILAYINSNCLNCIVPLNQLEKISKKEIKRTIYFLKLSSENYFVHLEKRYQVCNNFW